MNGEARAYPKRILAWHEMARDRLGGVELTLVYCTLCGSAIPYESEVGGQLRTFGTSGFLYRSNKLMFDEETRSLWSTLEGKPVIGELVNSGLRLQSHPIVTTGWKEWKSDHPDTTVLSLHTGYPRDYSEGAAYREYFSTDRLMFSVPKRDPRLKNKDEVLVMRLSSGAGKQQDRIPIAISVAFLEKHPVYQARLGGSPPGFRDQSKRSQSRLRRGQTSLREPPQRRWPPRQTGSSVAGNRGGTDPGR